MECGRVATWNVEGITNSSPHKLFELIKHMRELDIAVLCLQETHCCGSEVYEFEGHLVILSGSEGDQREYGG